jgi:hypothetical protein
VKTLEHEGFEIVLEKMGEFFEDDYERGADEAAPIWVPGVVDYRWIGWDVYGWLFGVDLVVTVPARMLRLIFLRCMVHEITIEQMRYDSALQ